MRTSVLLWPRHVAESTRVKPSDIMSLSTSPVGRQLLLHIAHEECVKGFRVLAMEADHDYLPLPAGLEHQRRRHSWKESPWRIALIVLVLAAAVIAAGAFFLWPRSPEIHVEDIDLLGLKLKSKSQNDSVLPEIILYVNLGLELQVKNPNYFAVSYDRITVHIDYRGDEIGKVDSSGGKIPARKTVNLTAGLNLEGLEILSNAPQLIADVAKEKVSLKTRVVFSGNVKILFIKPHVEATAKCSLVVNPQNTTILSRDCDLVSNQLSSSSDHPLLKGFSFKPTAWYMIVVYVVAGLLVLLILGRILWPTPPEVNINSFSVQGITADSKMPAGSMIPEVILNVDLGMDLRIRNRSCFSVTYDKIETTVSYYGYQLGKADLPGGAIPARDTASIPIFVNLQGVEIMYNAAQLLTDYAKGELPIGTQTEFSGYAGILCVRAPIKVNVQYDLVVNPSTNEILKQSYELK